MTRRRGHSLAELVVTVTFLGAGLGAVGASTILGARWAGDAAEWQRALDLASVTLDSITGLDGMVPGSLSRDGLTVEWISEGGSMVEVQAFRPSSGRTLARLRGRMVPAVPVVPLPSDSS